MEVHHNSKFGGPDKVMLGG